VLKVSQSQLGLGGLIGSWTVLAQAISEALARNATMLSTLIINDVGDDIFGGEAVVQYVWIGPTTLHDALSAEI
jgi:hypothetical protein